MIYYQKCQSERNQGVTSWDMTLDFVGTGGHDHKHYN